MRPASGLFIILPALLATLAMVHLSGRSQTAGAVLDEAVQLSGSSGLPAQAWPHPGPGDAAAGPEPNFRVLKAIYR